MRNGAKQEVIIRLTNKVVRKDAVKPDGTLVIIKPNTTFGRKSARAREKLMNKNGYKTEIIFYDPKDPKFLPSSPNWT